MKNRDAQTGQQALITFGPDTEENRATLTQDFAALIRWYASSDAKYEGDEQSLYRWAQRLEFVHQFRRA